MNHLFTRFERYILTILILAIFTWGKTKDLALVEESGIISVFKTFSLIVAIVSLFLLVGLVVKRKYMERHKPSQNQPQDPANNQALCQVCHSRLLKIPGKRYRCSVCNRISNG